MKRDKERDKSLILLLIMMLVIIATSLFLYFQMRTDKMSETVKKDSIVPLMFVVTRNNKPLLTEIFLFCSETGKGAMLDIPENTGSIITNLKKVDRIDVLFDKNNIGPYLKQVDSITELNIPFYYIISQTQLENLVDIIDGLDLFVPNPVNIKKNGQEYLLPSGSVTLDGSKIGTYLNYTVDGESDAEKIDRYQKFMTSFLEKIAARKALLSTDDLHNFLKKRVTTNMDRKSFKNFLSYLSNIDMDKLQFNKVLGVKRVVDNKELLFPHYDGRLLKEMVRQIEDYLVNVQTLTDQGGSFSVQVLNGTDVNGLASRTSQILKSFGYKIAGTGNAVRADGKEYDKTVILDRKGNPDAAKSLAALIKCDSWFSEADASLDDTIDMTLILGKDFDGRYVK